MSVSGRILDSDSKNMISATLLTGDNQFDSRKITCMDVGIASGTYTIKIADRSDGVLTTAVLGRFYALQFTKGATCEIQNDSSYTVCVIWDSLNSDMNGASGTVSWKFRVLNTGNSFSETVFTKYTFIMIPFMLPAI